MKNIRMKLNAAAITTAYKVKSALNNDGGFELLQVLIVVVLAIVLGGVLLTSMQTQFQNTMKTVAERIAGMFA